MGNFEVIASMGHCGTKWLSKVLDAGTDTKWYHELRGQICGTWLKTLQYEPFDGVFHQYWARVDRETTEGSMGDANSWLPMLLPKIQGGPVKIDRVIYLKRNPVQQLHSLSTKSHVWSRKNFPLVVEIYLMSIYRIGVIGEIKTRWEKLCLLVAANDFLPGWLRSHNLPVEVYDLETLTTDVDALLSLAPNLTRAEAERWQKRDVNRKVWGDRRPETIWQKWTDEQREGFERILGKVEL